MDSFVLSVLAIGVAIASLVLNVVQWFSSRRPYVGLVSLEWDTIDVEDCSYTIEIDGKDTRCCYPDSAKCTIKNVGQVPAKDIHIAGQTTIQKRKKMTTKGVGLLFPGQQMGVNLPFEMSRETPEYLVSGYAEAEVQTQITYRGILPWTKYKTEQNAVLVDMPRRWLFLPGGNFT